MTKFITGIERQITLTLNSHTESLPEAKARELVYELAEALGIVVVDKKTKHSSPAVEWLTRDDFDRTVTARLAEHYAHRAWNQLCLYGSTRILQVKCGVCDVIIDRDHISKASHDTCAGAYEHSKSRINITTLIEAFDSGALFDSFYSTKGDKVERALTELAMQLRAG